MVPPGTKTAVFAKSALDIPDLNQTIDGFFRSKSVVVPCHEYGFYTFLSPIRHQNPDHKAFGSSHGVPVARRSRFKLHWTSLEVSKLPPKLPWKRGSVQRLVEAMED